MRPRTMLLTTLAAVALLAAVVSSTAMPAVAPLPRLPKMVWELYLQEEYQACGVAYGLYARLPEADRAKLHAGTKIPLDSSKLTRDQGGVLAAWFNSARWGCNPPSERLDADSVCRSTLVFKCEDRVVEFCLQSPEQGIWKKLTIASAPGRAEWVRDGLPLTPHWYHPVGWEGGLKPPEPTLARNSVRLQEECGRALGQDPGSAVDALRTYLKFDWLRLRAVYCVYAQLPPGKLRELHRSRRLQLRLQDLTSDQQDALAEAVDTGILSGNIGFGRPVDFMRPPDARRKHFGITQVVFEYRRDHPNAGLPAPPGVNFCPRPFRRVFLTFDRNYPRPPEGYAAPGLSTVPVAMPLELQRGLLDWKRRNEAWSEHWQYGAARSDGASEIRVKSGAPPRPRYPAD